MRQTRLAISDGFSHVIKRRREGRNLSRAALAALAGLHQTYIGLLERGERSPNLETAKAIAQALGVSLTEIIEETERVQKKQSGNAQSR